MPSQTPLILASTSAYRRELLARLRLPFEAIAPDVDETPQPGEAPAELAARLALAKAHAVAARHPQAVVIGSDQVAELDGLPLGKPGHHAAAVRQLRAMSGLRVLFHTAVAVVCRDRHLAASDMACVRVTRTLSTTCTRTALMTAPAAQRSNHWASRCCNRSSPTTRPPSSGCR